MAVFLKNLEPMEWHDTECLTKTFKTYNLPKHMIEFLNQDNRRIPIENNSINYIDLRPIALVLKGIWENQEYLNLTEQMGIDFEIGVLVWLIKKSKLAILDIEHDELNILCNWKNFISDPAKWMTKLEILGNR